MNKHNSICTVTLQIPLSKRHKCEWCDFETNEEYAMKQHNRDKHKELTASVSPPPKKRKYPEFVNYTDIEKVLIN